METFPKMLYVRKDENVDDKNSFLADVALVSEEECLVAIYELHEVKRLEIRKTLV